MKQHDNDSRAASFEQPARMNIGQSKTPVNEFQVLAAFSFGAV